MNFKDRVLYYLDHSAKESINEVTIQALEALDANGILRQVKANPRLYQGTSQIVTEREVMSFLSPYKKKLGGLYAEVLQTLLANLPDRTNVTNHTPASKVAAPAPAPVR